MSTLKQTYFVSFTEAEPIQRYRKGLNKVNLKLVDLLAFTLKQQTKKCSFLKIVANIAFLAFFCFNELAYNCDWVKLDDMTIKRISQFN